MKNTNLIAYIFIALSVGYFLGRFAEAVAVGNLSL